MCAAADAPCARGRETNRAGPPRALLCPRRGPCRPRYNPRVAACPHRHCCRGDRGPSVSSSPCQGDPCYRLLSPPPPGADPRVCRSLPPRRLPCSSTLPCPARGLHACRIAVPAWPRPSRRGPPASRIKVVCATCEVLCRLSPFSSTRRSETRLFFFLAAAAARSSWRQRRHGIGHTRACSMAGTSSSGRFPKCMVRERPL